jgi:general secretion pathway protein F/type IV pilus assembly protein PilC
VKFTYQGVDLNTAESLSGEVNAVSEAEALRQLADQQIEVIVLDLFKPKRKRGRSVKQSDLIIPLQELSTLTASGVTLVDAIRALAENDEQPRLADGFKAILSKIESGENLSDAISASSLPFPNYIGQLVTAGEASGQLAKALTHGSEQLNYEQSLRNDLRGALTYPIILIFSGVAAMLIIFFAVVPKFSHLLHEGKALPLLAELVLSAGKLANEHPVFILGGMGALVLSMIAIVSQPAFRDRAMNIFIKVPVIGPWLNEQDAARWASLCAAMLQSKVSVVTALKLAAASSGYKIRKARAVAMISDIEAGNSFTEALERARLLPPTSINLISVGDKTGKLGDMLQAAASLHDASCKRRMRQVLTLMEPVAILVVGVMIGIMILGIVLAITASTDIAI